MTILDTTEVEPGRFVVTPHPVTLEGQTNVVCDLIPGETLYTFLSRQIDLSDQWEVTIGGVVVPVEHWIRVKPKNGQMIEVRGAVNKQALMIVAMIALTYFTFGAAAVGGAGAWGGVAAAAGGGVMGAMAAGIVFAAGSMLINKALGPKVGGGSSQSQPDPVHALSSARNRARNYEPFSLLLGVVKITPDLGSNPYSWYHGNDQFLGFVLNAGINVDRIDALSNGPTLLSSYDEVTITTSGFPGMPEQDIPQHTNADTTSGGELAWEGDWVERTTSPDTVRIEIGLEYILYDNDNKGRPYYNQETVVAQYRPVGTTSWLNLQTANLRHDEPDTQRGRMWKAVPKGQYDVRVHRLGRAGKEKGAFSQFQWTTLVSVQTDETDYAGISRIGVTAKATGQLNGPMDEIAGVAHAKSMPVWDGSEWQTATDRASGLSNPGAQILAYARGFHDENGKLIAGMGIDDEQIDIEALKTFMLHCAAEGYTYDNYVQTVRSHDDMLGAIALAGFGQVTWAGGRLSVVWSADGQPLSGVVNMATIAKGQFQVDYTLANAADGIEYTYFDRETWQPATLRVAAPGVTTMLNPATLTGEGVTTEEHAAQMARYHLAQHVYQYKDISYSTDLEHLSYRRLSVLALQHDLTKWGKGGRLMSVDIAGDGTVTLTMDEPVPAPASGNAYIGLRMPGEAVYRIFSVTPFVGESDTIALAELWPVDVPAVPGDYADNPAHDTIWIYDFKQTPGYRVRVVAIEPESDLKGANVAVVPEPPEFWVYVKTGEYTPPVVNPMLPERPTASNLKITEAKIVQGDTVFTELSATFDVSGPMDYASVHASFYVEADAAYTELKEVAQTKTRTARWRISQAGQYAIVVRPYDANGIVGGVTSTVYVTVGADLSPVALDYFTVTELDGGVRSYAWGYNETTIQPADYDGAEIRYITGNVADPEWDAMTPLGDDGIHPVAFESVNPVAGLWTFACRPRNTSGRLGPAFVITVTLAENLGEQGVQTGEDIAEALAAALAADAKAAQEIIDRQQADAALALEQATLTAEQAVLRAQIGDILQADEWVLANEYPSGDLVQHDGGLYRALQDVPASTPITDVAYWEWVGDYASLGEAVSATAANVVVNTADILEIDGDLTAVSETVTQHAARMPAGTGKLGTDARITDVEQAAASANTATASRVTMAEAAIRGVATVINPGFEDGETGWSSSVSGVGPLPVGVVVETGASIAYSGQRYLRFYGNANHSRAVFNRAEFAVSPGEVVRLRMQTRTAGADPIPVGAEIRVGLRVTLADGGWGNHYVSPWTVYNGAWIPYPDGVIEGELVMPAGAALARVIIISQYLTSGTFICDEVEVSRATLNDEATARSVEATNVIVSNHGGVLASHTSQINTLQSQVSTLPTVYLQPNMPTGGSYVVGDMWLDSDDGNKVYIWNGSTWSVSATISGATVYAQTTAPAGSLKVGDLWFDIDDDNRMHRWDGSAWIDITDERIAALSTSLSTTKNTVTQQGTTLLAHGDQLDMLEQSVEGKASSAQFNSLSGEVDVIDGKVVVNSNAISGINTTIGQQSASITEVARIAASGVSGNAVINPSFETDDGWGINSTGYGGLPANADFPTTSSAVTGARVLRISASPSTTSIGNQGTLQVKTGQKIRIGYNHRFAGTTSGYMRLTLRTYNAAGNQVDWFGVNETQVTSANSSSSFGPLIATYTVPAGVTSVRLGVQATNTTGQWQADDVFMEPVNSTEAQFLASYSMTIDNNGYITGWRFANDGSTGEVAILADKFSIVSPGGGARTEYSGGNWRAYDAAGVLRVRMGVW